MTDNQIYPLDNARRVLWVLACIYLVFVIYGSLVPLQFVPISIDQAIARFQRIPFLDLGIGSRADWVANLLLFIPLSFLWGQILLSKPRLFSQSIIRLCVFLLLALLACSIEFTQLYFPQRTVSQNDIFAESLGGALGLIVQAIWGERLQNLIGSLWQKESQADRISRLLHAYLLVLLVFNILPLDLTISPVEIYHKWKEGKVVLIPFGGLKGSFFENIYETLSDIIVWIPPGLWWVLRSRMSLAKVAVLGLGAGFAVEAAQLFVYSRVSDITDILLACVGASLGALFARLTNEFNVTKLKPTFWFSLWLAWLVCIFGIFWFPFDFQMTGSPLSESLMAITRVPFVTYYFGTEFRAINELLRKIGIFLPAGLLWGMMIAATQKNTLKTPLTVTGLVLIALTAFSIEIGQVFLPQKIADITDVFLEFFGGFLGLLITRWITSSPKNSQNNQALVPKKTEANDTEPQKIEHSFWKIHLFAIFILFAIIGIVTQLPFIPYNFRELIHPGKESAISIVGLGLAIYWIINGHFIFLNSVKQKHILLLPFWLLIHGLITWTLIRTSVPLESIHDIIGAPVLNWLWEWELIGRYIFLHSAIMLQSIGACLLILLINKQIKIESVISWLIWSVLLSWPLHTVVVEFAATDNLTELMRGGGTFTSSTILAIGFLTFFTAGSALAICVFRPSARKISLLLALIASIISASCFWLGSEEIIIKYGRAFSAWQFILSSNRQNYAVGIDLVLRFILAYCAMTAVWAAAQATAWRQFKIRSRHNFGPPIAYSDT